MAPQHQGYGGAQELAPARLLRHFEQRNLSLDDEALSPVLEALKILGWRHLLFTWPHPRDIAWSQRFSAAYPPSMRGSPLALLHVPPRILHEPEEIEYRQVDELLSFIARGTKRIRVFSYMGEIVAPVFRSKFRELRGGNVDIEFKPWSDVREFLAVLEEQEPAPSHPFLTRESLLSAAARRLLGLD